MQYDVRPYRPDIVTQRNTKLRGVEQVLKEDTMMFSTFVCAAIILLVSNAATVLIKRVTGASGSQTLNDITTANTTLNSADIAADGVAHPTQIPAAGTNYSYFASVCLVCSVAPPTAINNIYVYSDGSNTLGAGVGANVSTVSGTNGSTTTNYTQATGSLGVTGLEMGANYGHSISTPTNFFSYTSASPLALTGTFTTGVDTAANSAAGRFADWLIEQLTVGTTASAGTTPTETVTFVWDEF